MSLRIAAAAALLLPTTLFAASLELNPGMWETTTTRTNPMTGAPTTETNTECLREDVFDPRKTMDGVQNCSLVEEDLSGDTLTFRMNCSATGGASADVAGRYQTDGQTMSGEIKMTMNMGGMTMVMDIKSTGKRLGDC